MTWEKKGLLDFYKMETSNKMDGRWTSIKKSKLFDSVEGISL